MSFEDFKHKKMSRREFIKGLVKGGGALAGASILSKFGFDLYHIFSESREDENWEITLPKFTEKKDIPHERPISFFKKEPKILDAEERYTPRFRGLRLDGTPYESGIRGDYATFGKMERALRYKLLTDLVERKYGLPQGIIFSMFLRESNGRDVLPNALGDGGIGLCHMQAVVARDFGLETLPTTGELVDHELGERIIKLIDSIGENPVKLSRFDDRFHPLKNIDAVGRMLITYMHTKLKKNLGPLRSAIFRYAGEKNFPDYWEELRDWMTLLKDENFFKELRDHFNKNNQNLIIDGRGNFEDPFSSYIFAHQKAIILNYHLKEYIEDNNEYFDSERIQAVLATYEKYLIKKDKK